MRVYRAENLRTNEFLGLYLASSAGEAKTKACVEFGHEEDHPELFVALIWRDDE
jgi:hypothetical protein